jgi:hypothetical protein
MNPITKLWRYLRRYLVAQQSHRAAVRLANTLWQRQYLSEAPAWQPADDTAGVISQIDNLAAGLHKEIDRSREDAAHSALALKLLLAQKEALPAAKKPRSRRK